jgi:phosphatidylinositol alpha-1,6-mannosyltransferase
MPLNSKLRHQSLIFVMTGAYGISGGIATVNKNILNALLDLIQNNPSCSLKVLSLLESSQHRPSYLSNSVIFKGFSGNKSLLSLELLRDIFSNSLFIFDHVTLALPLLPFATLKLVKTVIFAHGSESWKRIKLTSQWSFQSATLCLTNSDFTLRKMQSQFSGFRGSSCILGLSPDFKLNPQLPRRENQTILLEASDGCQRQLGSQALMLTARLHPGEREKGHYQLVKVLPKLLAQFPEVQLIFPGEGDDRENFKSYAISNGVASSVFLPGYVSKEILEQLYCHCYAFVMPSKQEGFGLVYLEAMNWAKPCVGCFDDGAEDVIIQEKTGLLVHDPDNEDELIRVLTRLLKNPLEAQSFGEQGFYRLHEKFTTQHMQSRFQNAISELILC